MLTVLPQVPEQCVSAELATLEIHSLNVDSNLAPPALVVSMLNVVPMADLLSVSVDLATLEIPTLTVYLILAPALPADRAPSVRTMVGLQSVNVHQAMSAMLMFHADKIPVLPETLAVLTLTVPTVVDVPCASVGEVLWAVPTVGRAAEPILVYLECAELEPSVRMLVDDLSASVCQGTKEIPTLAVSKASVTRILTAARSELARTTNVLTPALSLAVRGPTVQYRTTWPSVGVPAGLQVTPSRAVAGSPGPRSAPPAAATLTARLGQMTDPSVPVSQPTLEILFLSADTSVTLTVSVGLHSHVIEYLTDV